MADKSKSSSGKKPREESVISRIYLLIYNFGQVAG